MIHVQSSEEVLEDGKNIMATCGVLAALILSFIFGSSGADLEPNEYNIWEYFGEDCGTANETSGCLIKFAQEGYGFVVYVLSLGCVVEVLITSRAYIALCLAPPEAGRAMGFRLGGDVMMGWNFAMFAVIAVCMLLLVVVHCTIVLRWGTALVCLSLFVIVVVHSGLLMGHIDSAAFEIVEVSPSLTTHSSSEALRL